MDPIVPISWKEFFARHATNYDQNAFTYNTKVEVQFMIEQMPLQSGMAVLDIGCGTGRHSIELAQRGFNVTGVDLTPEMLNEARQKSAAAGVDVEWVEGDATQFARIGAYDAAICICEGGFNLTDHGVNPVQHNLGILNSISASLKPGSPFLLTALNAYSVVRRLTDEAVANGSFDPASMTMYYADEMSLPEGPFTMYIHERPFFPPEISSMLYHAGFDVKNVWGGTAGDWGVRALKLDEIEVMFLCQKR